MDTKLLKEMNRVNAGLADIKSTNQEILRQLDILEAKRKAQNGDEDRVEGQGATDTGVQDDPGGSSKVTVESGGINQRGPSTTLSEPFAIAASKVILDVNTHKLDEEIVDDDLNDTWTDIDEETDGASESERSIPEVERGNKAVDGIPSGQTKTNPITDITMTSLNDKWKCMQGFTEKMKLTEKHVIYGSVLRRNKTDICQDNRISDRYRITPNQGRIYQSRVTNGSDDETYQKHDEGKVRERKMVEHQNVRKAPTGQSANSCAVKTTDAPNRNESQNGGNALVTRQGVDTRTVRTSGPSKRNERILDSKVKPRADNVKTAVAHSKPKPTTGHKPEHDGAGAVSTLVPKTPGMGEIFKDKGALQQCSQALKVAGAMASDQKDSKMFHGLAEISSVMSELPEEMRQLTGDIITIMQNPEENPEEFEALRAQMKAGLHDKSLDAEQRANIKLNLELMEIMSTPSIDKQTKDRQVMNIMKERPDVLQTQKNFLTQMKDNLELLADENDDTTVAVRTDSRQQATGGSGSDKPITSKVATHRSVLPKPGTAAATSKHVREVGATWAATKQEEPVYIKEELWSEYANEEVEKAKIARDIREKGMDTIFCLDLSESMKGDAWEEALQFMRGFIEGIQNLTLPDDVYEHVALVTFGGETKVQQHLTCDYFEVVRKLERLKPGGPSPLFAGVMMCWAAVLGAGTKFKQSGYTFNPRIYLLTDGRVTPASMIAGPDKCPPRVYEEEKAKVQRLTTTLHTEHKIAVNAIPVGDFDLSLLEKLTSASGGKLIQSDDWETQASTFKNYLAAASVGRLITSPEVAPMLFQLANPQSSDTDREQMVEFINTHASDNEGNSEVEIPEFPPLGSRVKRNMAYYRKHQVTEQVGTVTAHMRDGHIGVTWDQVAEGDSKREKMQYESNERHVIVVNEPRVLQPDELIGEGCRVKRGSDWHYGDQDGGEGNIGVVIGVDNSGLINVRWENSRKNGYRFGLDGKFEIEVVEEIRSSSSHSNINTSITTPAVQASGVQRSRAASSGSISTSDIIAPKIKAPTIEDVEEEMNKKKAAAGNYDSDDATAEYEGYTTVNRDKTSVNPNKSRQQRESEIEKINRMNSSNSNSVEDTNGETLHRLNKKNSAQTKDIDFTWKWKDHNDVWHPFPQEITCKIETSYKRNTSGTALITFNGKQYRIVFTRMERVDVETKDKCPVLRQ